MGFTPFMGIYPNSKAFTRDGRIILSRFTVFTGLGIFKTLSVHILEKYPPCFQMVAKQGKIRGYFSKSSKIL